MSTNPWPNLSSLFTNTSASDRYIEMTVKGIGAGSPPADVTILPRLRLLSSPYAFLARNAVNAGSLVNGANGQVVTVLNNTVGINTNSPGATLDVNGSLNASSLSGASATLGGLTVNGAGLTVNGAATAQGLTVNGTASVSNLTVSGSGGALFGSGQPGWGGNLSLLANQGSPVSGRLAFGTDGRGWQFRIAKNQGGTLSDLFTVTDGGAVGIGLTPRYTLDVLGTFDVDLAGNGGGRFWVINNPNDDSVYLEFSGTNNARSPLYAHICGMGVDQLNNLQVHSQMTGFLGAIDGYQVTLEHTQSGHLWTIGTDHWDSLDFFQDTGLEFWFNSGGVYKSSDARLKKEVRGEAGLLDKVLKLRPVSYRFKAAPEGSPRSFGFIAQDLEKVFPEVVSESIHGTKGVAYAELIPVSIGAIQELQAQVQRQKADIEKLRGEVAELRAMVVKLAHR